MFEALRIAGVWHNRSDRDYRDWPAPQDVLGRRHPAAPMRWAWAARSG
jgi:hypothetical protein